MPTSQEQIIKTIEQYSLSTLEAIERSQQAQREGFKTLSDALNRVGEGIEKQIAQTVALEHAESERRNKADSGGMNWGWLIGIGGLLIAVITPLYTWQSWQSQSGAVVVQHIESQIASHSSDIRDLRSENAKASEQFREVETQFLWMWDSFNTELQKQDRLNGIIWDKNNPEKWPPRSYYHAMGSPPQTMPAH